jgi:cell division septation protein DedD
MFPKQYKLKAIISMKHILILIVCYLTILSPAFCDDIAFIEGDLKEAKARAAREGKLIFLDFWASYCTPCRMMEEYTFTDASVAAYVREHYIPVKVDIQSFDGFDLKKQYGVVALPTVIVLNSKGVQLGRHEESMGASKFVSTLAIYNEPKNRVKINTNNNMYNTYTGYSNTNSRSNMVRTVSNNSDNTKKSGKNDYAVAVKETTPSVNLPVMGAKRASIPQGTFTIQLGAFTSPDNLQDLVSKVKTKTGDTRVFVSKKEENGRLIYRVLLGSFVSRSKAQSFLKHIGLQGYIREFSTF